MKKNLLIFLLVLSFVFSLFSCAGGEGVKEPTEIKELKNAKLMPNFYYENPLVTGVADPFILFYDNMYYMYSTGGKSVSVWTSKSLNAWNKEKDVAFSSTDAKWAYTSCWAPEVINYNGSFYMFISSEGTDGIHRIGVLKSDSPLGKFKAISSDALIDFGYSVIDANVFIDDDGKVYLYYSRDCSMNIYEGRNESHIYGVEISADLMQTVGEPVLLTRPDVAWEQKSGNTRWNEGPCVFKDNDTYYLMYSANCYSNKNYSVGYATAASPLGEYTKAAENPIIKGDGGVTSGTGHNNIFRSKDNTELYAVYHSHTVPPTSEGGRQLCIDKLIIDEHGRLSAAAPTITKQPLPSGTLKLEKLTEGFELTTDGEVKNGDTACLTNGKIAGGKGEYLETMDLCKLCVKFDEAQPLQNVWIYKTTLSYLQPSKYDMIINGEYKLSGKFDDTNAVAVLSNLPKDYLVEMLDIVLYVDEGRETLAISEIVFEVDK